MLYNVYIMSIERGKRLYKTVNRVAGTLAVATFAIGAAFCVPHFEAGTHDQDKARAMEASASPDSAQEKEANALESAGARQIDITAQRGLEVGGAGFALVGLVEVMGIRRVERAIAAPAPPQSPIAAGPPQY
jgi:hypothetical protein